MSETPEKTRLELIHEILTKHQHDVLSYDAWYLEGCEGCNWKPDRDYNKDENTDWRQFYIHVAKEIELLVRRLDE